MIKVLHLRSTDRVCGPGKTILESHKKIDSGRFSIAVGLLTNLPEKENQFWLRAMKNGVPTVAIRGGSRFSLSQVRQIRDIVESLDIDIIHSHEYKSDILGLIAAKITKKPIVTTAHGWISNSLKSKVYLWFGKKVLRWFDHVIAVSPEIRAEILLHRVPREKVDLVYNAIVESDYDPSLVEKRYLRDKFSIDENTRIIGCIGRFSREKGQEDFIRAAEKVLDEVDNTCFVLVGDGPDFASMQEKVTERRLDGKILFTGYDPNVKAVFRDLDVFALTSLSEGFPNVILEALCMGVPVVATNVGGVSDIVKDGETGVLVEPGDVEAIACGIRQVLEDENMAWRTVESGRALISRRFEFSTRMRIIESVYDKVIESKL